MQFVVPRPLDAYAGKILVSPQMKSRLVKDQNKPKPNENQNKMTYKRKAKPFQLCLWGPVAIVAPDAVTSVLLRVSALSLPAASAQIASSC